METYTLNVAGLQRELPKVKIHDELAIASFVMFGDTELIETCAEQLVLQKGFPARKSVKGYMTNPVIEKVQSITTIGAQTLVLDISDLKKLHGKRICIIDDVVSTGGSLVGLEKMLNKYGKIVCKAAVLLEEAGYDKDDVIYLEKLPIFKPE